jgi:hypothetical protein
MSDIALADSAAIDLKIGSNSHFRIPALLITDFVLMLELIDHTKPTKLAAGTNRVTSSRSDGNCSLISIVLTSIGRLNHELLIFSIFALSFGRR